MHGSAHDFRLALRAILRRPGSSAVIVATLAIGIGANTAIYSVFNSLLFRPVPGVRAPGELTTIRFHGKTRIATFTVSFRDYVDFRDRLETYTSLAASAASSVHVAGLDGAAPRRVDAEIVTDHYFEVLGVDPSPGRAFTRDEAESPGAAPAVVISRAFWRTTMHGDPAAVGHTLVINGNAFTIIGVAPDSFAGPSTVSTTELWLPVGAYRLAVPGYGGDLFAKRTAVFFFDFYGRLRPGATLQQAQDRAAALVHSISDFGGRPASGPFSLQPVVYPGVGLSEWARGQLNRVFTFLISSVGLLLMLACANAANLLLARGMGRRRELAVCQAIGASRSRLVRQQLAEGLILSAVAGGAGVAIALGLTSLFEGTRIIGSLPALKGIAIDWRVIAFTSAVSVVAGLVFAIAPALVSSRVDLQSALKNGLTVSRHGRQVLRSSMVALQVAVSLLLLLTATLFARSLANVHALDIGMDVGRVVTFSVDPGKQGYKGARLDEYYRSALEQLRAITGVEEAAFSWTTPFGMAKGGASFRVAGAAEPIHSDANYVSPGYFRTMGIPLKAGRDFRDGEPVQGKDGTTGTVAIISEQLARQAFPNGNAVGSRVVMEYPKGAEIEIIGIVGDVRGRPVTDEPEPMFYHLAIHSSWGSIHVRTARASSDVGPSIRDVMRRVDAALPIYDLQPFSAAVEQSLAEQRLLANLSRVFAAIAALLAAIGIYGMMAAAVAERRRELGIRLALGADAGAVVRMIVRAALGVSCAGVVAGLAAAALVRKPIESRLFGLTSFDPLSVIATCAALLAIALASSLIPAVRASRMNPVASLRME